MSDEEIKVEQTKKLCPFMSPGDEESFCGSFCALYDPETDLCSLRALPYIGSRLQIMVRFTNR
jgi:hypothetical protein